MFRNTNSLYKKLAPGQVLPVFVLMVTIGFADAAIAGGAQLQFSFRVKTAIEQIAPDIPTGFGMPMKYVGTAQIIKIDRDPAKQLKLHAKGVDTGYVEFPNQIVLPDGSITAEPISMQVVGIPNLFGGRLTPVNSATISFGDIDRDGVEDSVLTHGNGYARMVTSADQLPAIVHYFGICTVDGGTGLFSGAKGDIFLEGDMTDPDGPGPRLPTSLGVDKAFITLP